MLRVPKILKEAMNAARNGERVDFSALGRVPHIGGQIIKAEGDSDENRKRSFILSDKSVDRDNDTIDPNGWELGQFQKNGAVLWAHDSHQLPIAKPSNTRVEDEKLLGDGEFATAEEYAFADTVFRLISGGFLKGVSVGFMPIEWTFDEQRGGIDFIKQTLLEWSVVPVGSNPNAMDADAKSKGYDLAPIVEWGQKWLDRDDSVAEAIADEDEVSALCKSLSHWTKTPSGISVPAETLAKTQERDGASSADAHSGPDTASQEAGSPDPVGTDTEGPESSADEGEKTASEEVVGKVVDYLLESEGDVLRSFLVDAVSRDKNDDEIKEAFPKAFEEPELTTDEVRSIIFDAVKEFKSETDSVSPEEVRAIVVDAVKQHRDEIIERKTGKLPY